MGRRSPVETRFRERVKQERKDRGLSQADLSKLLQDKGLEHILASTVAKIEAGERSVRIDEASVLADLFELPVDALLGRGGQNDLGYVLRMVTDTASQSAHQVSGIAAALSERIDDAKTLDFDSRDTLIEDGQLALDFLNDAASALALVAGFDLPPEAHPRRPDDYLAETWPESTETGRQLGRDLQVAARAVLQERRATKQNSEGDR